MALDKHTLALVSIVGSSLDALGALYLAYDLLGGEHGPLRTLTRAVTYGVLFGVGYGLALGPVFGLACGISHGPTLAWEYARASRQKPKPELWHDVVTSAIRGLGFALGAAHLYGWTFGVTFGALAATGQVVGYQLGIRPTLDLEPAARPRLTSRQILGIVNRTVGYAVAGYMSAVAARHQDGAWSVGIKTGLAVGVITAIANAFSPAIEWGADHVPEKRMGVFGLILILVGFALQSVQYWVALLS